MIHKSVDAGFEVGMAQVREEITAFAEWAMAHGIKKVLEIGTLKGGTAVMWLELGCELVSVDLEGGHADGVDLTLEFLENRNKRLSEKYSGFTGIIGDSHSESVFVEVEKHGPFDMIFIDGDHSYNGVRQDYEMYSTLAKPGGLVAFHDINDTPAHRRNGCMVSQFWDELEGDKREFNRKAGWGGIGVIRLPGNTVSDSEIARKIDRVLVACPTYSGLSDVLDEYLAAYNAFEWPSKELLLVDNTGDDGKYAESLKKRGLNVVHIEPDINFQTTFSESWKVIQDYANEHEFKWVMSIEQDVICPPLTIDALLNVACYINAPLVTHRYPYHYGVNNTYQGLGCTLILRDLLNSAMELNETENIVEGCIYNKAVLQSHASLTGMLDIKHLDGTRRYWQYEKETDPRVMYPPEYGEPPEGVARMQ